MFPPGCAVVGPDFGHRRAGPGVKGRRERARVLSGRKADRQAGATSEKGIRNRCVNTTGGIRGAGACERHPLFAEIQLFRGKKLEIFGNLVVSGSDFSLHISSMFVAFHSYFAANLAGPPQPSTI